MFATLTVTSSAPSTAARRAVTRQTIGFFSKNLVPTGSKINCEISPAITALGLWATRRKSSGLSSSATEIPWVASTRLRISCCGVMGAPLGAISGVWARFAAATGACNRSALKRCDCRRVPAACCQVYPPALHPSPPVSGGPPKAQHRQRVRLAWSTGPAGGIRSIVCVPAAPGRQPVLIPGFVLYPGPMHPVQTGGLTDAGIGPAKAESCRSTAVGLHVSPFLPWPARLAHR